MLHHSISSHSHLKFRIRQVDLVQSRDDFQSINNPIPTSTNPPSNLIPNLESSSTFNSIDPTSTFQNLDSSLSNIPQPTSINPSDSNSLDQTIPNSLSFPTTTSSNTFDSSSTPQSDSNFQLSSFFDSVPTNLPISSSSIFTPSDSYSFNQSFINTNTDLNGLTQTSYPQLPPQTIQNDSFGIVSTQSNSDPSASLNFNPPNQDGFFNHRGAVIGTFLTLGFILLATLSVLLWRLSRFRKFKLRSKNSNHEIHFDKIISNQNHNFKSYKKIKKNQIHHQNPPQVNDPLPTALKENGFISDPSLMAIPEQFPVRFTPEPNIKPYGRSSDLDTLNTLEWSQYVDKHFTLDRNSGIVNDFKPTLMLVKEKRISPRVFNKSTHPHNTSHIQPPIDVQTVDQEDFAMINSPNFNFEPNEGDNLLELTESSNHDKKPLNSDFSDETLKNDQNPIEFPKLLIPIQERNEVEDST